MDSVYKQLSDVRSRKLHSLEVSSTKEDIRAIYDGYHINGKDMRSERAKKMWDTMNDEQKLRYCIGLKQRRIG